MSIRERLTNLLQIAVVRLQLHKLIAISIVMNLLQIFLMALASIVVFTRTWAQTPFFIYIVPIAALFVIVGASFDIRDALSLRKLMEKTQYLTQSLAYVEKLNSDIRAQRHDFMNHLQVVHSLIELGDSTDALDYIGKVYGNIQRSSRALKTDSPAINALLSAKISDLEHDGIAVDISIQSTWQNLPMPAWEMCRVLGNILDNARDALKGTPTPQVSIAIYENLREYGAAISNNGPLIPADLQEAIFDEGISTKGDGHGMGLNIVRELIKTYGGAISLDSDEAKTCFTITLPRAA